MCQSARLFLCTNPKATSAGIARTPMSRDEGFRPRLGRIRSRGGKTAKRYLGKLYGSMEKMRPGVFARRSASRFTGERIGRGTGVAAAFASGAHGFSGQPGFLGARRVTVKVRSVRLGGDGIAKARAHLFYLQRDGAGEDGAPAKLYGPERDAVDGEAFLKEAENDRHQFRIIVSPEDGKDLADLTDYTRDLMDAAQKDLGTRLDWVAVNHFNTDHPHAHIVLRGKADDGRDLVIAKKYVTEGFRARAQEIATLELGPRREIDIARARMAETSHERLTSLDRDLLARAEAGAVEIASAKTAYDRFHNKLLFARLKTLKEMGLAEQAHGQWRVSENLEASLQEMGRRGDIIRTMSAAMGADIAPSRVRDFEDAAAPAHLVGRVAGYGARDDAHVERIIAVEGADGNQWRVGAVFDNGAAPLKGAIVEVARTAPAPRQVDRTIAAIAARHEGVYSDALHAEADPSASAQFRLAHKRRLEALRRAGAAERLREGTWRVPGDFHGRSSPRALASVVSRVSRRHAHAGEDRGNRRGRHGNPRRPCLRKPERRGRLTGRASRQSIDRPADKAIHADGRVTRRSVSRRSVGARTPSSDGGTRAHSPRAFYRRRPRLHQELKAPPHERFERHRSVYEHLCRLHRQRLRSAPRRRGVFNRHPDRH